MAEQQGPPPLPLLTHVRMFVSITYTENSSPSLHPQESDLGTHSRVVLSRFFHSLHIRANICFMVLKTARTRGPWRSALLLVQRCGPGISWDTGDHSPHDMGRTARALSSSQGDIRNTCICTQPIQICCGIKTGGISFVNLAPQSTEKLTFPSFQLLLGSCQ